MSKRPRTYRDRASDSLFYRMLQRAKDLKAVGELAEAEEIERTWLSEGNLPAVPSQASIIAKAGGRVYRPGV